LKTKVVGFVNTIFRKKNGSSIYNSLVESAHTHVINVYKLLNEKITGIVYIFIFLIGLSENFRISTRMPFMAKVWCL